VAPWTACPQGFKQTVGRGQEEVEVELADSKLKKLEGDNYRSGKLKDLQKEVNAVAVDLAALHKRKAELEEELRKVGASISKASARERQLEEERLTFEESNTEVLDHLRTSMAELESQAVRFTIEGALVRCGLCIMDGVFAVDESARLGAAAAHGAFEEQTERNFLRACIWHAK